MSYDFAAANSELNGSFNSTKTLPLTIACFIKYAVHPISADYIITLHKDANVDEFMSLQTDTSDDEFSARQSNAAGNTGAAYQAGATEYDGIWVPLVMTSVDNTAWDIYVELLANNTARTGQDRDPGPIGEITMGAAPNGASDFASLMAECAVWNGVLSDANITSYLAGNVASGIDSANLLGYWPLDTDRDVEGTILNEGTDAGGTLTISNAVFAADHPTITSGITTVGYHAANRGIMRGVGRGVG